MPTNPPTIGDIAYNEAINLKHEAHRTAQQIRALEARIKKLEKRIDTMYAELVEPMRQIVQHLAEEAALSSLGNDA